MKVSFYKKDKVFDTKLKQVRNLWEISFNKSPEDDMDIVDNTIIGLLEEEQKLIGIVFLLCLTKEELESDNEQYKNIKDQGVTENDCYLYNFCISKTERKKGLGKFFLKETEKYIKKDKIVLFVDQGNVPAICLYNKMKYRVHRAGLSGFVMKKNLSEDIQ